jgi:hypothetical protein
MGSPLIQAFRGDAAASRARVKGLFLLVEFDVVAGIDVLE